jgi:hypothetical protein
LIKLKKCDYLESKRLPLSPGPLFLSNEELLEVLSSDQKSTSGAAPFFRQADKSRAWNFSSADNQWIIANDFSRRRKDPILKDDKASETFFEAWLGSVKMGMGCPP